jgi:hypothetical protein
MKVPAKKKKLAPPIVGRPPISSAATINTMYGKSLGLHIFSEMGNEIELRNKKKKYVC